MELTEVAFLFSTRYMRMGRGNTSGLAVEEQKQKAEAGKEGLLRDRQRVPVPRRGVDEWGGWMDGTDGTGPGPSFQHRWVRSGRQAELCRMQRARVSWVWWGQERGKKEKGTPKR